MVYMKWKANMEEHTRMPCVPGFAHSVSDRAAAPGLPGEQATRKGDTARRALVLPGYTLVNKACRGCEQWKTSGSTDTVRLLCCLK